MTSHTLITVESQEPDLKRVKFTPAEDEGYDMNRVWFMAVNGVSYSRALQDSEDKLMCNTEKDRCKPLHNRTAGTSSNCNGCS